MSRGPQDVSNRPSLDCVTLSDAKYLKRSRYSWDSCVESLKKQSHVSLHGSIIVPFGEMGTAKEVSDFSLAGTRPETESI